MNRTDEEMVFRVLNDAFSNTSPTHNGEGIYTLSVVVDVNDSKVDIDELVNTLAVSSTVAPVEVVITTSGKGIISGRSAECQILELPNTVRCYRWDEAFSRCGGDFVAFFDAKSLPMGDWIATTIRNFSDSSVGMVIGQKMWCETHRLGRLANLVASRIAPRSFRLVDGVFANTGRVRLVGTVTSFVFPRDVFRHIGGFQSPTEGMGPWERTSFKVTRQLGLNVKAEPSISIHEPCPRSLTDLLKELSRIGRERGSLRRRFAPYRDSSIPLRDLLVVLIALVLVLSTCLFAVETKEVTPLAAVLVTSAVFGAVVVLGGVHRKSGFGTIGIWEFVWYFVLLSRFARAFVGGYLGPDQGEVSPKSSVKRPLRVLVVNWRDTTHPWAGGAENYVYQIIKNWDPMEFHVEWLTQRYPGSTKEDLVDGFKVYRVGGRVSLYLRVPLHYLTSMTGRYDLIIDCENGIPFFTPLFSRIPVILLVHHVHQEIFRQQLPRYLSWIGVALEGVLMPRVYRNCKVVAVSNGTKADLVKLGFRESQIDVITNGVFEPPVVDVPESLTPTLLCMGRLKPQKAVDVLIRAVPQLIAELGPINVDILGQGPDRSRLETLAVDLGVSEFVRFHGYVSSLLRDQIASRAWMAVCPSSFEGWGVVCMEASARGLPVVASDVSGLNESVRDGETGLLFPFGDSSALASKVITLVRDLSQRESMGKSGKLWARAHSWSASSELFAHLLTAISGRQQRSLVESSRERSHVGYEKITSKDVADANEVKIKKVISGD